MFLATTALSQFWDKKQEILFLGAWCLRYDQQEEWEGLRYRVMPNPWDDRKRFGQAYEYLDGCYERILTALTSYLNRVHHVSFSTRYWRVLLGIWLLDHLHAVYDRYVHLNDAFKLDPKLQTILLDPQSYRIPVDTLDYARLAQGDLHNLQIFSQLIQARGCVFQTQDLQKSLPEPEDSGLARGWASKAKEAARRALILSSKAVASFQKDRTWAALCFMYCSQVQLWTLAWRTGFRSIPYEVPREWTISLRGPVFDERRNGLASLPTTDLFEQTFVRLLPQNFPSLYLENYPEARKEAVQLTGRIPAVIVSTVGWYSVSEPFKFMSAEASERGSRLVTVQQGSYSGYIRYMVVDRYEASLGNSFIASGWAEQEGTGFRNVPSLQLSPCLSRRFRKRRGQKAQTILFVATMQPWYLQRFQSQPTGQQWTTYVEWQSRFLAATPENLHSAVLFRPYMQDWGIAIRKQLSGKFSKIRWEDGLSFRQRLKRSDVVVIDHPGTTAMETLVANIPAILFWDQWYLELRDEAEPEFEPLRQAGILWHSPEEAAAKLESISDDPWAWWGSEAVQTARQRFVDRYALAREDWSTYWAEALAEEIALSQAAKEA